MEIVLYPGCLAYCVHLMLSMSPSRCAKKGSIWWEDPRKLLTSSYG